ncbi:MAG TPA: hypothetical protein DC019_00500 [Ruminococcus sp.]|jgi:hypothetical protein|nr:hypothetical protein [Ruminococcus sp.]
MNHYNTLSLEMQEKRGCFSSLFHKKAEIPCEIWQHIFEFAARFAKKDRCEPAAVLFVIGCNIMWKS